MRVGAVLLVALILLAGCGAPKQGAELPSSSQSTSEATPSSSPPSRSVSTTLPPVAEGTLVVTMIDVGQGMAVLVQFPDSVALVDIANRFSSSTNLLLAALESRGIHTIDHLVATNPDADHVGGCDEVAQQFEVKAFYHPGNPKDTQTWDECIAAMQSEGAAVHSDAGAANEDVGDDLDVGELLPWSSLATVQLLNADSESSTINAGSIALLIRFGQTGILFSGDMDCGTEDGVIARGYDLDIDILQAGHHGSKTSSCNPWLQATTPQDVLIPVGTNSYGHPTPETLSRIEAVGATTYRTDLNGDITVTVTATGYTVAVAKGSGTTSTATFSPSTSATESSAPATSPPAGSTPGTLTAGISNASPCQYSTVSVSGSLTDTNGAGIGNVQLSTTWHYKSGDKTQGATTSGSGSYSTSRAISSATAGYTVVVDVATVGVSPALTASTSFTPVDC